MVPNYNQMLFTTGDCSKWLYMDRTFAQVPTGVRRGQRFTVIDGTEKLPVYASHLRGSVTYFVCHLNKTLDSSIFIYD